MTTLDSIKKRSVLWERVLHTFTLELDFSMFSLKNNLKKVIKMLIKFSISFN